MMNQCVESIDSCHGRIAVNSVTAGGGTLTQIDIKAMLNCGKEGTIRDTDMTMAEQSHSDMGMQAGVVNTSKMANENNVVKPLRELGGNPLLNGSIYLRGNLQISTQPFGDAQGPADGNRFASYSSRKVDPICYSSRKVDPIRYSSRKTLRSCDVTRNDNRFTAYRQRVLCPAITTSRNITSRNTRGTVYVRDTVPRYTTKSRRDSRRHREFRGTQSRRSSGNCSRYVSCGTRRIFAVRELKEVGTRVHGTSSINHSINQSRTRSSRRHRTNRLETTKNSSTISEESNSSVSEMPMERTVTARATVVVPAMHVQTHKKSKPRVKVQEMTKVQEATDEHLEELKRLQEEVRNLPKFDECKVTIEVLQNESSTISESEKKGDETMGSESEDNNQESEVEAEGEADTENEENQNSEKMVIIAGSI